MTEQKWRSVERLEPVDFYAEWLAASERNQFALNHAPVVARGRDVLWIETVNDHRLAMLIGPQVGFASSGTNLCKAIVPPGHHSGRHRHGEEAIHVLTGRGCIVIEGRRYDVRAGTTVHVPFMADHQVFNLGDEDLEYVTASAMDLDLFVRLGRLEQLEPKGKTDAAKVRGLPAEHGQFDTLGRRIALHLEDAPDEQKMREEVRSAALERGEMPSGGHEDAHGNGHEAQGGHDHRRREHHGSQRPSVLEENPHRHGAILILMGGGESPGNERNGFTAVSVAMTNVFEEVPHTSSHCHSHTEAVLYVLEGVGFSEIDFEHYDWEAGDAVHVPPKMTRHEHFNPSDRRTRTLRIEYGIRYFYEPQWSGYAKVEHRETAIARP
jgi:mannose-6-phosphate isomerase-like protein (cupin superfamily)